MGYTKEQRENGEVFTLKMQAKVKQLNHPLKTPLMSQVSVQQANSREIEQFISLNSEPKTRYKRNYSKYHRWNLRNGNVAFVEGKMINPVKVDIDKIKKYSKEDK